MFILFFWMRNVSMSDIYLHLAGPGQDLTGAGGLLAIGQSLGRGRGGGDRTGGRGIEEEEPCFPF